MIIGYNCSWASESFFEHTSGVDPIVTTFFGCFDWLALFQLNLKKSQIGVLTIHVLYIL